MGNTEMWMRRRINRQERKQSTGASISAHVSLVIVCDELLKYVTHDGRHDREALSCATDTTHRHR
jgi:hypothetical protein